MLQSRLSKLSIPRCHFLIRFYCCDKIAARFVRLRLLFGLEERRPLFGKTLGCLSLFRLRPCYLDSLVGVSQRSPQLFLGTSNGPAGATPMARARDLVSFALMHLNDGVTREGVRMLSAGAVRAMREPQLILVLSIVSLC